MSDELLINVTPRETRVALVENGVLQELYLERASCQGLVGNIYKGRVCRVLPGMQAAFVEIGLERAAFLHASDICLLETEGLPPKERCNDAIQDLVREGQDILVQVIKDPLGTKGARLTTQVSIPSRYLVFMPRCETVGISQKIEGEEERQRLKALMSTFMETHECGGYIARTAAEGVSQEMLEAEMSFLCRLWKSIQERAASAPPRSMVHEDLRLVPRSLRDLVGPDLERCESIPARPTTVPWNFPASSFLRWLSVWNTTLANGLSSTSTTLRTSWTRPCNARCSSSPAAIWYSIRPRP